MVAVIEGVRLPAAAERTLQDIPARGHDYAQPCAAAGVTRRLRSLNTYEITSATAL